MREEYSEICIRCNECCKWMTFIVAASNTRIRKQHIEYYQARGCRVTEIEPNDDHLVIMVPCRCPNLVKTGECRIYGTRPVLCREYDGRWDPYMEAYCKLPKS